MSFRANTFGNRLRIISESFKPPLVDVSDVKDKLEKFAYTTNVRCYVFQDRLLNDMEIKALEEMELTIRKQWIQEEETYIITW